MGNGISQEQLQSHLNKQEALIRQLQAVVHQQSQSLAAMGHATIDYTQHGRDELPLDDDLNEEVVGLRRAGNAVRKIEPPVDEDEKQLEAEPWTEMTPEEERNSAKPWLAAMAPPTGFEYGKTDAKPKVSLELEHVYGYRAQAVRGNVIWVDHKTVLYFTAGVGIVHDIEANKQKFFRGHSDDILCVAYHPGRRIAVTGEKGKIPSFHVWSIDSGEELAKIAGFHQRGVAAVAFSVEGSTIASVGLDDKNSVAVYDWESGTLLASEAGDASNRILDVRFNTSAGADSNTDFVTVGVKHINFWTLAPGNTLRSEEGLIGNLGDRQAYLCLDFTTQYTVLGCQSGELYVFKGTRLVRVVAAHQQSIYALRARGDVVVTGGKDGFVSRWDLNTFEKTANVNMNKQLEQAALQQAVANNVRAVALLDNTDEAIVGTLTSTISRVNLVTGATTPVVQGHYGNLSQPGFTGELWGLATSSDAQRVVSAGEDSTLRIWDCEQRKLVATTFLSGPAQCAAWSPDGKHIAVGLHSGSVSFLDANGVEFKSISKSRRRIQSVRFSPSGKLLVAGSADNVIHVFDVTKEFEAVGKLSGHASVILKMDFSVDERYLQTCSQSYELIFFDLETMKAVKTPRELKDVQWATYTSILGWDVQGIWPKYSDGSDVNSVCRSHSKQLLATAENTGLIKIFNYPCVGGGLDRAGNLNRRPESLRVTGHSDHVTEVAWTAGDQRVISVGGSDLALMQWRVVVAAN
jgi:WD40 repeat protein